MRAPKPLDVNDLAAVNGGASRAQKDERILDKIQSLVGAVGDVAAQQQQKPNPAGAMMPLVAMAMMKKRQQV